MQWIKKHVDDVLCEYKLDSDEWKVIGMFIVNEPLMSNSIYGQGVNVISKMELSIERIREVYK